MGIGFHCTSAVNIIHLGARNQDPELVKQETVFLYSQGYL
jgi:hypothetical protein